MKRHEKLNHERVNRLLAKYDDLVSFESRDSCWELMEVDPSEFDVVLPLRVMYLARNPHQSFDRLFDLSHMSTELVSAAKRFLGGYSRLVKSFSLPIASSRERSLVQEFLVLFAQFVHVYCETARDILRLVNDRTELLAASFRKFSQLRKEELFSPYPGLGSKPAFTALEMLLQLLHAPQYKIEIFLWMDAILVFSTDLQYSLKGIKTVDSLHRLSLHVGPLSELSIEEKSTLVHLAEKLMLSFDSLLKAAVTFTHKFFLPSAAQKFHQQLETCMHHMFRNMARVQKYFLLD